jgi:hypothetical protein
MAYRCGQFGGSGAFSHTTSTARCTAQYPIEANGLCADCASCSSCTVVPRIHPRRSPASGQAFRLFMTIETTEFKTHVCGSACRFKGACFQIASARIVVLSLPAHMCFHYQCVDLHAYDSCRIRGRSGEHQFYLSTCKGFQARDYLWLK